MSIDAARRDDLGLGDDPDLLLAASEHDGVDALVNGTPVEADYALSAAECTHTKGFMNETVCAALFDEATGTLARWEVRVRVQCADCGTKFAMEPQGHAPRDGGPGIVHVMRPLTT